jgi:lipopolysaccharide biosynthesis glycosyltransferase
MRHLFSKNSEYYKKIKNIIHITFSINNNKNYKYILLVSMFSVLKNCNKRKTFIIFHILCTPDFEENSITIFKSLLNKFYQNTEIIFYNMGNHFINRIDRRISQAAYYRLIAPLFINSDRLIHLDGDTLIFSDLTEMYNLDFNDNYVLGIYDYFSSDIDYLGIKSNIYINSGVILLNLKKLRKDKKVYEFLNLTNSDIKITSPDQTVINYLLYPKIGRLKSKYAIFNFDDVNDIQVYLNHLRNKIPIEEVVEALKNPTIIHNVICYPKLWFVHTRKQSGLSACNKGINCSCKKYFNLWHYFANQTDYYNEIARFTGVK